MTTATTMTTRRRMKSRRRTTMTTRSRARRWRKRRTWTWTCSRGQKKCRGLGPSCSATGATSATSKTVRRQRNQRNQCNQMVNSGHPFIYPSPHLFIFSLAPVHLLSKGSKTSATKLICSSFICSSASRPDREKKKVHFLSSLGRHDICQKIYATTVLEARILRKKRVNRNISQFATKERKCFKMA